MFAKESLSAVAVCLAFQLLAPAAGAQSPMPPEIEKRLREIGRVIEVPETQKLFAPLHAPEPYSGVRIARDFKYGPADRNRLDVFTPETRDAPRPVLLFAHGGGFVRGDKHQEGTPFYSNIGVWAARNGFVGVTMTYRYAPQHQWPAGAEDVAAAVRWVAENISAHGGNPTRIYLMGNSAGAIHAAGYLARPQLHGAGGPGIAGAILVSGLYVVDADTGPLMKAYVGEDASKFAEQSPLPGLLKVSAPLMVTYAELDPDRFVAHAKRLNDALCDQKRCPRFFMVPKHSHVSQGYAINTADREQTDQILAFVKSIR